MSNLLSTQVDLYTGNPQFEIFTMHKWGHPTAFEIDS